MTAFCDETIVHVKGGRGGSGVISFRHEKYVDKGGPDGGDGGNGGSVIMRVNPNLNTLSLLRRKPLFQAGNGEHGGSKRAHGKVGEDLMLEVPEGTVVSDAKTGTQIADLVHEGSETIIAHGGKGGFGNGHFASSTRQTPTFAERGEQGQERHIKLELKLVADVAIIGLPSVGKSMLISRISNAKPKIADYPFTTLVPNLGVVSVDGTDFVVADIPGLIEGASKGRGLGDAFLRHVQRCRVIVHMLDVTSEDMARDYGVIQTELSLYSDELSKKPQIVVFNKVDVLGEELVDDMRKELENKLGIAVMPISCVTGFNLEKLLYALVEKIKALPRGAPATPVDDGETYKIFRPHLTDDTRDFRVENKHGVFFVHGKRIEQIVAMTDFNNPQGVERVYDILRRTGIRKELQRLGCTPGATVRVGDVEIEFQP